MVKSALHTAYLICEEKKQNVVSVQASLDMAMLELNNAKHQKNSAAIADRRLRDVKTSIVDRSEEIRRDAEYARDCAKVLISAYHWNDCNDAIEIAGYVTDLIPSLSWGGIINLIATSTYYTNKEAADLLRVTLADRQRLGLVQIRACDLSNKEFEAWRDKRKNERAKDKLAEQRRIEDKPTSEERKAADAAKKAYYDDLAKRELVSVATVRRRIKRGKLPGYDACKSGLSPIYSTTGELTFAKAASAHQARSKPSIVSDNTEITAYAAPALRPPLRRTRNQKNTPAVSDKGITKYNLHDQINSTFRQMAIAIASAPISIERVRQNAASACEQYAASVKRRSANG